MQNPVMQKTVMVVSNRNKREAAELCQRLIDYDIPFCYEVTDGTNILTVGKNDYKLAKFIKYVLEGD